MPLAEVVCVDKIRKMLTQLIVIVVVISVDGSFFDRAVHSLDLTVRPGMVHLGEAMLDAVFLASQTEHMR